MLEELCSYLGMRYDIIRQVLQPKVLAVVSGGVAVLWLSAGMPGLSYLCFGEEKNSVVQCRKALTEAVARGRKRLPLTIEDYTFGASVAAAEAETDLSGCVVEKLCVVSEEGHPQGRVPLVVCSPASAGVEQVERPAVLMIHATGRGKESVIPHLKELVDMGFVALGMDCRYHGARATDENIRKGYEQAIVRAWQGSGERPFLLDNVWDVQHVLDYACSRGDVDARRRGCPPHRHHGHQLGGHHQPARSRDRAEDRRPGANDRDVQHALGARQRSMAVSRADPPSGERCRGGGRRQGDS
uniref:Alpha beta-hydrolases superfamily protein n=1 Tax=Tetraselmis sp. GSL018 TaxID=582737 RepID=A0A061QVD6_9CHLO